MTARRTLKEIPRGIWILGFVSMLMDISSEMIHGLLPIFMVSYLGLSTISVGFIEGLAEGTTYIVKIFSGAVSDYLGKRKVVVVFGYGLAAITKPLFPLANSIGDVFTARFIDRVGKGIRGAPRDAMIGDISPIHLRGASYGLRQSLDTIGAVAGPIIAVAIMFMTSGDIRMVFWIAVIPAFLCVVLLMIGIKEPENNNGNNRTKIIWSDLKKLKWLFWWLVIISSMMTLARFSEAFLVLYAQHKGLTATTAPMIMIIMNIAYLFTAYPAGYLSDKIGRKSLLLFGIFILFVADIVLACADGLVETMVGITLWGVHMGFTQGLIAAMVADTSPNELRGTAFGIQNLATGLMMLFASLLAGIAWELTGPASTFLLGAFFSLLTIIFILPVVRKIFK